jgi:cytidylate kinase
MTKPTISAYLRDHLEDFSRKQEPGPYLTISRQFGCEGFELGQYLLEKFNERDPEGRWKMYYKELLRQLADDTGLTEEIIEQERFAKPSLFKDFLRGLGKSAIPDGYEIRNKITLMVRTVAYEGHAIIIGQGGASATADIHNGLSVRIEAPRDWRIARVSIREKIDKTAASAKIMEIDRQRKFIHKLYEEKNPREPAFSLVFDNSIFKKEQIAELILRAMEQKGLIAPATA